MKKLRKKIGLFVNVSAASAWECCKGTAEYSFLSKKFVFKQSSISLTKSRIYIDRMVAF